MCMFENIADGEQEGMGNWRMFLLGMFLAPLPFTALPDSFQNCLIMHMYLQARVRA